MKLYTYIKVRMVSCILNCILKGHSINFPQNIASLSLKIDFVIANSVDP